MGSSRVNFTPKPTSTQIIHLEVLLITPLQSKRIQLHETHCYHALSEDQTSSEAFGEKGSGPRTLPQATQKPHGDGSDNRSVGNPRSDGHMFVTAGERCSAPIRWLWVQTPRQCYTPSWHRSHSPAPSQAVCGSSLQSTSLPTPPCTRAHPDTLQKHHRSGEKGNQPLGVEGGRLLGSLFFFLRLRCHLVLFFAIAACWQEDSVARETAVKVHGAAARSQAGKRLLAAGSSARSKAARCHCPLGPPAPCPGGSTKPRSCSCSTQVRS